MGRYVPLCRLTVEHEFHTLPAGPAFRYVPSAGTSQLAARAGIITRLDGATLNLFRDVSRTDALRMDARAMKGALTFVFKVYAADPVFQSATDPEPFRPDAILYFQTPARVGRRKSAPAATVLHREASAGTGDFRTVADLLSLPDTLEPADVVRHPDFVVSLTIKEQDLGEEADWSAAIPAYRIHFAARQTIWKYYLLGRQKQEPPSIVDTTGGMQFEFAGPASLPGDRTALTYRSMAPIPLRDRYTTRFQLKADGEGGGRLVVRRLPAPQPGQFGKDVINGVETLVSEIFVNT